MQYLISTNSLLICSRCKRALASRSPPANGQWSPGRCWSRLGRWPPGGQRFSLVHAASVPATLASRSGAKIAANPRLPLAVHGPTFSEPCQSRSARCRRPWLYRCSRRWWRVIASESSPDIGPSAATLATAATAKWIHAASVESGTASEFTAESEQQEEGETGRR